MRDDDRPRLLEHLAACYVVGVIVAVDQVFDGLVESLLDLVLKPSGGFGVDRIGRDHALWRDQEHRDMEVVLKPIEIARHLSDFALRFLLLARAQPCSPRVRPQCDPGEMSKRAHHPPPFVR